MTIEDLFDWINTEEIIEEKKVEKGETSKRVFKKTSDKTKPTLTIRTNKIENRLNNIEKQITNIKKSVEIVYDKPDKNKIRKEIVEFFRFAMNGRQQYKISGAKNTAEFEALFIEKLFNL